MKLVISEKTGKTYQAEVPKENEGKLVGLKIGDSFDGAIAGADGYGRLAACAPGGGDGEGSDV